MTSRDLALLLLFASSSLAWAADSKEDLTKARADYRQAVTAHGEGSPEAKEARRNLRQSRRTFHTERRERQHSRPR